MCNRSIHYFTSAAVVARGLRDRGVDKAEAAETAIVVATSNAMVDHATAKNYPISMADELGMVPVITQAYPGWSARVVLGGGTWPVMERCHLWHHDEANGWPKLRGWAPLHELDEAMQMYVGQHLHPAQDYGTKEDPGPHRGYVGYPSHLNYERTQAAGKLDWYERMLPKRAVWSHMLDPEADKIERCRAGAVGNAASLYAMASGHTVLQVGGYFVTEKLYDKIMPLLAVARAKDDKELEAWQAVNFKQDTGQDLPPFKPFDGERLRTWFELARSAE